MLRSRPLAFALTLLVTTAAAPRFAHAQPAPAEVKSHLDAADKAAKAKDWEKALVEYRAAFDLGHGTVALVGVANAAYELKRVAEAYEAYDEISRSDAPRRDKATADTRLKELGTKVGTVTFKVSETGAEVRVDDKVIGTSPVPPKHLAAGEHKIKVTHQGFNPFEQAVSVGAGASIAVDATLQRAAAKGHVIVKEKDGKQMRVVVDGLDVGATPWEGDLDPGAHEILVRSSAGGSTPQRVEIERGKTQTLELATVAAMAHMEITASESGSLIFMDGKPLAESSFTGDVAPGEHTIVVSKEGYQRFEKKVLLVEKGSEKIEVKLEKPKASIAAGPASSTGLYGGFSLVGLLMPASAHNELDDRCTNLGASACDTANPLGAGVNGYIGYSFDPIGFEVLLAAQFDQSRPSATFPGSKNDSAKNPGIEGIARTESFTFLRFGGLAAARVRANVQWESFRVSFAGGVGASYKSANLIDRTATSIDGQVKDVYAPPGTTYFSPGVTLDLAIQWRLTPTTALALGAFTWLETAGSDTVSPEDRKRFLGIAPLHTPEYHIAQNGQLYVGPYLGMQFGP